jgi:hypothetical protein
MNVMVATVFAFAAATVVVVGASAHAWNLAAGNRKLGSCA